MLGTATFPAVTSRSAIPSPKLVATSVQRGEAVGATSRGTATDAEPSSMESMRAWMHANL
jgi:hypothetical protein